MAIEAGTYELGPESGRLTVHTGKAGAAARAGHNLTIEVTRWSARATFAADLEQSELSLTADSHSMRVVEGSGGMQSLGDDDKQGIAETIDAEVLKGTAITFASTAVTEGAGGSLSVTGDLELSGASRPITFELSVADGAVSGRATVTQTEWGMKPYSALFGTLKVSDDVAVEIDARLTPTA